MERSVHLATPAFGSIDADALFAFTRESCGHRMVCWSNRLGSTASGRGCRFRDNGSAAVGQTLLFVPRSGQARRRIAAGCARECNRQGRQRTNCGRTRRQFPERVDSASVERRRVGTHAARRQSAQERSSSRPVGLDRSRRRLHRSLGFPTCPTARAPEVTHDQLLRSPIDAFVLKRLEARQLSLSDEARPRN